MRERLFEPADEPPANVAYPAGRFRLTDHDAAYAGKPLIAALTPPVSWLSACSGITTKALRLRNPYIQSTPPNQTPKGLRV